MAVVQTKGISRCLKRFSYLISDVVKEKGYIQTDGSVAAREIEKENEGGHGGDGQEIEFAGKLDALAANGLLGEWTVDILAGSLALPTPVLNFPVERSAFACATDLPYVEKIIRLFQEGACA